LYSSYCILETDTKYSLNNKQRIIDYLYNTTIKLKFVGKINDFLIIYLLKDYLLFLWGLFVISSENIHAAGIFGRCVVIYLNTLVDLQTLMNLNLLITILLEYHSST
jgi:hypothetical protein